MKLKYPSIISILIILTFYLFFDIYRITSSSMERTFFKGDIILVRKAFSSRAIYKRNDIILFKQPISNDVYIKRCIALPGDTINVNNNKIYINSEYTKPIKTILYEYKIFFNKLTERDKIDDFLQNNQISFDTNIVFLTNKELDLLDKSYYIDSIVFINKVNNTEILEGQINNPKDYMFYIENELFYGSDSTEWDLHKFGPIFIPAKGSILNIDKKNKQYYKLALKYELKDNSDNIVFNDYKVKNDFYFMLGDNRNNSFDSRYWGFLPKDKIIGKTLFTLYSKRKKQFFISFE